MTETRGRSYFDRGPEERVIGTYMSPVRVFGALPNFAEAEVDTLEKAAHEIIREIDVPSGPDDDPLRLYVTRIGGIFAQPPFDLSMKQPDQHDWPRKREFERQTAGAINVLLCELAALGAWSEPVAPIHLGDGWLYSDGRAVVAGMVFHAETGGLERAHGPLRELRAYDRSALMHWTVARGRSEDVLDQAARLNLASLLLGMSPTLPLFVTTTFAMFVRRRVSETIMNSWIVCEQIINHLWETEVVARRVNGNHRESLQRADVTAAIRHDVLTAFDHIDRGLYNTLRRARKNRNDLMHAAGADIGKATECVSAMCRLLEAVAGQAISVPDLAEHDEALSW